MKLLNDSDDSGGRNGKIHQEVGFFPSVPSLVCCTLPILTCKGLPRYPILPSSYPPIIPPSLLSHLGLLPSVSHRYPILPSGVPPRVAIPFHIAYTCSVAASSHSWTTPLSIFGRLGRKIFPAHPAHLIPSRSVVSIA